MNKIMKHQKKILNYFKQSFETILFDKDFLVFLIIKKLKNLF